ncbi:phage tail protein [Marinilabiliaceae bacterium JC017]|nr:phage tail protein [Marinilabiliaceae bacterium JC017]
MEAFISFIALWPLQWAPRNWAVCWGTTLSISENSSLYALIGLTYGGDGITNFMLPDFRGRVPVGYGKGRGLSDNRIGWFGGLEVVRLTNNEIPTHTHGASLASVSVKFMASDEPGTQTTPGTDEARTLASTVGRPADKLYNTSTPTVELNGISANGSAVSVQNAGGSLYHENRQPYLVTNYIMCLQGIFPPRQ